MGQEWREGGGGSDSGCARGAAIADGRRGGGVLTKYVPASASRPIMKYEMAVKMMAKMMR